MRRLINLPEFLVNHIPTVQPMFNRTLPPGFAGKAQAGRLIHRDDVNETQSNSRSKNNAISGNLPKPKDTGNRELETCKLQLAGLKDEIAVVRQNAQQQTEMLKKLIQDQEVWQETSPIIFIPCSAGGVEAGSDRIFQ